MFSVCFYSSFYFVTELILLGIRWLQLVEKNKKNIMHLLQLLVCITIVQGTKLVLFFIFCVLQCVLSEHIVWLEKLFSASVFGGLMSYFYQVCVFKTPFKHIYECHLLHLFHSCSPDQHSHLPVLWSSLYPGLVHNLTICRMSCQ